jgi:UDP-N-acetylmuramoylalanine--D-glutamate ligase
MNLKGKKIAVIGMGKTGISTARFLAGQGASVIATDEKPSEKWGAAFEQMAGENWLQTGDYNANILEGVSMVVPSPGIPPVNEILQAAVKNKIPVISEVELASCFIKAPIIAVTGTNGKTTTTTLLGEILTGAGKKVFVGGNIGNPLIDFAGNNQDADFIVAEISSFQLQWIEKFRPFVAVLLNITCDHVNYHGSFDEYRRIKARVFENQTAQDFAIINAEDQEQKIIATSLCAQVSAFSSKNELPAGIFIKGANIVLRHPNLGEEQYPLNMIKIPGLHNVENVMAALMTARFCGCSRESIIATISGFSGLSHRIEFVAENKSVRYYDDSKGTNVGSVIRALDTFSAPVILLLGGRDKDGDFQNLKPLLAAKAKQVILFGEARNRIELLIGKSVLTVKEPTLLAAIETARKSASAGDVVLLSPGCASFDEFSNYKERGNFFKQVVRNF